MRSAPSLGCRGDIGDPARHFVPSFVSYVISFLLAPLEVVVAEHVVVAVSAEGAGVAAGQLGHDGLALRSALQAEDGAGEVERLLHCPDVLVLVWWKNLRGIAYGDPTDGHRGSRRHGRIHMHDAVDPHFGAGAETRPVEDARACGDEDGIFHGAA